MNWSEREKNRMLIYSRKRKKIVYVDKACSFRYR